MTTRDFQKKSQFQIFFSYFRPHWRLFVMDLACALMISLIDLAFPYISRWCMYELLPQNAYKTFFAVMAVVFAAFALRAVFTYIIGYWGHTFGILVEADIRRDLFRHMQELSFDYFDRNRTGQLMSRLTADLFDITELAHHGPEDIFISGVTIVGSLIILFTIQWRLALVIALILPVFFLVVWRCRRSMSEASARVKQKTAVINADIESGLSGIRTAKAFANEETELRKFDSSNDTYKTSKRQFHKAMGRFNAAMEFFLCALSAAVIAAGGGLIMAGKMDIVDFITFSLYITTFVNPVRKLSNFAELFANGTAGLGRFVELMREEPAMKDAPDAMVLSRVEGRIDVDHVSFAYQDDLAVLHDVDLHIRPGETVAVVGPSGGGKTTTIRLLLGLVRPQEGRAYLQAADGRQVEMNAGLRRYFSYVPQGNTLLSGTIADNLRMVKPDADDRQLREALEAACAWDFVSAMDGGLNASVGEHGHGLSEGQAQRIAIARALLRDAPVLLLDEATSALDVTTERTILRNLAARYPHKTFIVTTHRPTVISLCRRVYQVSGGRMELLDNDRAQRLAMDF